VFVGISKLLVNPKIRNDMTNHGLLKVFMKRRSSSEFSGQLFSFKNWNAILC